MVATRTSLKASLDHFIEVVLELDQNCDLALALSDNNIKDIGDLEEQSETDIGRLTYTDPATGAERPLSSGQKRTLILALGFLNQSTVDTNDHTEFAKLKFADWRIYTKSLRSSSNAKPTPTAASGTTTAKPTQSFTPAESFKKGIKRDQSAFPDLTDERMQEVWHLSLIHI